MHASKLIVAVAAACSRAWWPQFWREQHEVRSTRSARPSSTWRGSRTPPWARRLEGTCNPWWAIDYPDAEAHFPPAVARMTRIDVAADSRRPQLSDEHLFDYPWLFCSNRVRAGGAVGGI
jgi:hypothetical protein